MSDPAWAGRRRYVGAATGVDAVVRLLDVWNRWRADPAGCDRLTLIAIVPDLDAARAALAPAPAASSTPLAARLAAVWPVATPGLHAIGLDGGRVTWLLGAGSAGDWLPRLGARVDGWWLGADVGAAPVRIFRRLARLSAVGARLVAAPPLSNAAGDALQAAGFAVETATDRGLAAVYAPRFPRRIAADEPADAPVADANERVLVVGAGLAGCAVAWALAEQGRRCTLYERRPGVAQEASGNVAGIFHGVVHAADGHHARFNRSAALAAADAVRIAIERHGVTGSADGALRLETRLAPAAMRALLDRLRLPADYVQALDAAEASARAGLTLASPAWFYPGGGWVRPGGLARSFLERAAAAAELRTDTAVDRIERTPDGWRLVDAGGRGIAEAPTVALANAGDALRLLAPFGAAAWPVEAVRGQLAMVAASDFESVDIALPRRPVAGAGYLLPEVDGLAVFGATAQAGDLGGDVRRSDHAANLERLGGLLGRPPGIALERVRGRTGWRWSSRDRLPLIGAVPDEAAMVAAARQRYPGSARANGSVPGSGRVGDLPRLPGLFVFTALGSRGIGWAALGARLLAAQVAGAPLPLETDLVDAVDPARFAARASRLGRSPARER